MEVTKLHLHSVDVGEVLPEWSKGNGQQARAPTKSTLQQHTSMVSKQQHTKKCTGVTAGQLRHCQNIRCVGLLPVYPHHHRLRAALLHICQQVELSVWEGHDNEEMSCGRCAHGHALKQMGMPVTD